MLVEPTRRSVGEKVWLWSGLKNGDVGRGIKLGAFNAGRWDVSGTFGVGGSIQLETSPDSTDGEDGTWSILGAAITSASGRNEDGVEREKLWVRPHVTAGDGTTSLNSRFIGRLRADGKTLA